MKLSRAALFVASVGLLGMTVALPARAGKTQDEPNAEAVFKSIKSFKGQKVSVVIPAMHTMSSALGVDCQFCHVEGDFSAETKKQKETARDMIAMTHDINEKQFGGKPVIGCMSCHDGHTHPSSVAGSLSVRPRIRPDASLTAQGVTDAYWTAVGRPAAGTKLDVIFSGTLTQGGSTSDATFEQTTDGLFLLKTAALSEGYDGSAAWYSSGGHTTVLPSPWDAAVKQTGYALWANLPEIDSPAAGKDKFEGADMDVVGGKLKGSGDSVKIYFDHSTHLLRVIAYFTPSAVGTSSDSYVFADYQDVSGTKFPMTVTHHGIGNNLSVGKFTSCKVSNTIPTGVFGAPKS